MKKKYFAAKAVLVNNEGREFEVTIYSMYESIEEAKQGIERFLTRGYNVKKVWIESCSSRVEREAYAIYSYRQGCWFYRVFDDQTEAIEHADRLWNQMCDAEKASYRFFCVAQIELDDNGDFSIHGAVPIKSYKIRKRVLIKNKIKKLLTFLKRKG